jgi:hypothetical protein
LEERRRVRGAEVAVHSMSIMEDQEGVFARAARAKTVEEQNRPLLRGPAGQLFDKS